MKSALLSIGLAFLIGIAPYSVTAQEPGQLTHEKRVYLNNGNTYVQKQLPLYFNFSTSPGGQVFDLKSKAFTV